MHCPTSCETKWFQAHAFSLGVLQRASCDFQLSRDRTWTFIFIHENYGCGLHAGEQSPGAQHSTKVILLDDALLNVTTSSLVVYKRMGFEAQPHGLVLRRDNVILYLISLEKHMLAVSNIYFFKKLHVVKGMVL